MEINIRYLYYLVWFMGNHAFHTPIFLLGGTEKVKTKGEEEKIFPPMEFVENMLHLVRSGTYVDSDRAQIIRDPFPIFLRLLSWIDRGKFPHLQPFFVFLN